MLRTDYGKIAGTYNRRYDVNYLLRIEKELIDLIEHNDFKNILEAGCGTGRWIRSLWKEKPNVYGLDYSIGMLKIAKKEEPELKVINADADYIPVRNGFGDLMFCVNAIHHFPDKEMFVRECRRVLTVNGMLAVFGVDPFIDKNWYVYDYFDSVYENDLNRFPSLDKLAEIMLANGFTDIKIKKVEEVLIQRTGTEVFGDPFLDKNHSSQLANLSDEQYQKGIEKIRSRIEVNPGAVFTTSVIFYLVSAKKK